MTCREYSLNPADELGIEDEWARFQFNGAVSLLGRYVQNKLNECDDKGNPVNELADVLARIGPNAKPPQNMSGLLILSGREVMDF